MHPDKCNSLTFLRVSGNEGDIRQCSHYEVLQGCLWTGRGEEKKEDGEPVPVHSLMRTMPTTQTTHRDVYITTSKIRKDTCLSRTLPNFPIAEKCKDELNKLT